MAKKPTATKPAKAIKTVVEGADKPEIAPLKKKAGRPTKFTQAIADEICERIADGEPIRQICLLEHLPGKRTIFTWLNQNEDFRHQYARAKEDQAEHFAEEVVDIADNGTNDWIMRESARGMDYVALNDEAIARSRLRVETRKWLMGKMKPKKYGEKMLHGSDPENPLPQGAQTVILVPAKNPPQSAKTATPKG